MSASDAAVQDRYPDEGAHCYGCGRLNPEGLRIRTRWDDGETVCRFTPEPHHKAFPGVVYGGLIASLFDCHGVGTAAAEIERRERGDEGGGPDGGAPPRFVTASLQVDFVRPTPLGPELEVRAQVREVGERKVVVDETLTVEGDVCARATVVAVRMPEGMGREAKAPSP